MGKTKVFITPETHWDREWVMTLGQYQIRLGKLIDKLIPFMEKNPGYRFLLDGQSIVIEDYLEIRPEMRERMVALMRSGQLVSGPWYVLADQFLENGESMIRNLMLGMRMVREMGGQPMMLGYVPDSFGSIATLPMLLHGFGIPYATYGRGRPVWGEEMPHYEFWWKAPDSSQVLAASHSYGYGIFLSYPDIWTDIFRPGYDPTPESALKQFMEAAAIQRQAAATPNLYFPVGCDHMEPRPALLGIVSHINTSQEEYELIYGTPEDYLKSVERDALDLKTYVGEMRGSENPLMDLVGTLSSHIPLKQANDECERLLQRVLEPLAVMHSALTGEDYPKGNLNRLWKLLLQNHPHDSICGCSVDQVHSDMKIRFDDILHSGNYLVKDIMHALSDRIDTRGSDPEAVPVTVFNPLGRNQNGPVQGLVRVPRRFSHKDYSLIDSNGKVVSAQVECVKLSKKDLESVYMTNQQLVTVLSKDAPEDHPDEQVFTLLNVDFVAESVPAFGYKTWWILPHQSATAGLESFPDMKVISFENGMENESLSVILYGDGTLDLTDKRMGHVFRGLHAFVDREDVGDGYDHHSFSPPQDFNSSTIHTMWKKVVDEPHRVTFQAEFVWYLPEKADSHYTYKFLAVDYEGTRSARLVSQPITVSVTLYAGVPRLDIQVEMDNMCSDHCLRIAFDTGLVTDNVSAYDHFNVISRQVRAAGLEWRDEPFQQFVSVSDGRYGFAVSTRGLPAYEAVQGEQGVRLYLTLLRSVGRVGPAAGANYPTYDAQCLGRQRFEYSLIPHAGDWVEGGCLPQSVDYRTPLIAEAGLPHDGDLPITHSLLEVRREKGASNGTELFASCLKKSEEGDGYVLRLWNPAAEQQHITVTSQTFSPSLAISSLDETKREPIAVGVPITLQAKGLNTLFFRK